MLKKIMGIIALISWQGVGYSYECNYIKLRDTTHTYLDEITQSNFWDLGIEDIRKDLNFLSNNGNNNIQEKYRQEDFESLIQRSLSLDPTGESLKGFIKDCQTIHDSGDLKQQQAVYMLLYDVTTELKKYIIENEKADAILNKNEFALKVSQSQKMSIPKEIRAVAPNTQSKSVHTEEMTNSKGKGYQARERVH
ncbi:MAG: hypothetical protein K0M45_11345 [Candidatus Paracaedibacteraceae bacterium]|nr:hypothetical protein [Candidatus Paracaedibacteraceae bacterium]